MRASLLAVLSATAVLMAIPQIAAAAPANGNLFKAATEPSSVVPAHYYGRGYGYRGYGGYRGGYGGYGGYRGGYGGYGHRGYGGYRGY